MKQKQILNLTNNNTYMRIKELEKYFGLNWFSQDNIETNQWLVPETSVETIYQEVEETSRQVSYVVDVDAVENSKK